MTVMNDTTGNNRERHFKIISENGFEMFLVFILFFAGWWFLSKHAGGPSLWDDLSYMNMSLNTEADYRYINRYFHVYLLKFFLWVAGDPFTGARLFWGFLTSATAALVYINARIISNQNCFLHGMIAVLFFYSEWLIFLKSGPLADYTVMMLVTAGLTVYLLYHRFNQYQKLILYLFGFIFFLAIKSKETGIIAGILVLGLGFSGSEAFNLKRLGRNTTYVLAGMFIGVMILMCLHQIFLGDALFSFRLSNTNALLNLQFGEYKIPKQNWYRSHILISIPAIFILYLISLTKKRTFKFKPFEKIVWLLPIGLALFLTVFMIKGNYGLASKHYLPAIPIICILAAQFFEYKSRTPIFELVKMLIVISLVLLIYLFIYYLLSIIFPSTANSNLLDTLKILMKFQKAFVFPVAFSALLMLLIFVRKWSLTSHIAALICVFLITVLPMISYARILKEGSFLERSEKRFIPFARSSNDVVCSEDASIYISENIYKEYQMLGRDDASSAWMFNIYFNCNLERSRFDYSNLPEDLLKNDYRYAYISKTDWQNLRKGSKTFLKTRYMIKAKRIQKDKTGGFLFFIKKDRER